METNNMNYRDMLGFSKKQPKKKVVKKRKPSVTEGLKKQFGDTINEGPAGDYAKAYGNVKKTYGVFWDAVHDMESLLKSKGLGRHAKELNNQYKKHVGGFYKFFFKMMDKLQ
tara:strand:- start:160 stop:495 length:336 start_codon:yes stop_codon:yes gene_type:complete